MTFNDTDTELHPMTFNDTETELPMTFNDTETELHPMTFNDTESDFETNEFEYSNNWNEATTSLPLPSFSKNDSMLMMRISSLVSDDGNKTSNPEKETFIRLEPSIAGLISAALSDKTDQLLNQLLKSNKKGKKYF